MYGATRRNADNYQDGKGDHIAIHSSNPVPVHHKPKGRESQTPVEEKAISENFVNLDESVIKGSESEQSTDGEF